MRRTTGRSIKPRVARLPEIPGEVYNEQVDVFTDREYRACMEALVKMRRERLEAYNAERVARGEEPITGYEAGSGE
jgi:hypothetical protein